MEHLSLPTRIKSQMRYCGLKIKSIFIRFTLEPKLKHIPYIVHRIFSTRSMHSRGYSMERHWIEYAYVFNFQTISTLNVGWFICVCTHSVDIQMHLIFVTFHLHWHLQKLTSTASITKIDYTFSLALHQRRTNDWLFVAKILPRMSLALKWISLSRSTWNIHFPFCIVLKLNPLE